MNIKFKKLIWEFGRSDFLAMVAAVFSLLYHVSFLFVFLKLGVMPMFYFNIFSVILFVGVTAATLKGKKKNYIAIYSLELFEVIIHQILATYYMGGRSAFYYLIISMGFLGVLILKRKLPLTLTYAFIAACTSVLLAIRSPYMDPVYYTPDTALLVIRCVNIFFGISLNFFEIVMFAIMSIDVEDMLKEKVEKQKREIEQKNHKVLELQNHMINSLANLVENRDSDTGNHIKRTSAYVEIIAQKAYENGIYPDTITEEFVDLIKRAAPLHDIGKIIVSDTILKKPGKLTSEEYDKMKVHTTEGKRIVREVIEKSDEADYIQIASDVAEFHHEKWNGGGYPSGKKGENIPVSARIMSIADVFDALISPRCYKPAFAAEKAFSIIEEERGTSFDPILVDLFLDSKDEVLNIKA